MTTMANSLIHVDGALAGREGMGKEFHRANSFLNLKDQRADQNTVSHQISHTCEFCGGVLDFKKKQKQNAYEIGILGLDAFRNEYLERKFAYVFEYKLCELNKNAD